VDLCNSRFVLYKSDNSIETLNQLMSKSVKLLNAMKNNPNDWEISQLQTVAKQNGVDWRHDGGSHCVFITEDGRTLSVPAHRPIKPIYIKKFVALIERV
jgi:hypothetical protein